MANIKSSLKRAEIAKRNALRNKSLKSQIKTYVKKFEDAIEGADMDKAKKYLNLAESKLRKAQSKNVFHKNTASRKIGQLTKKFNSLVK
ncbi:MAG: 30S ribosomal protein S20 [Tissierellia bacterium]|nr:30S ribosomal protein S20 [Tissierellia bacterium]